MQILFNPPPPVPAGSWCGYYRLLNPSRFLGTGLLTKFCLLFPLLGTGELDTGILVPIHLLRKLLLSGGEGHLKYKIK